MSDKFDQQAEALLPCECDGFLYVDGVAMKAHTILCPAYYRLIVAAALKEAFRDGFVAGHLKIEHELAQAQAEIARLGKQRDDLNYLVDLYRQNHEDAEALRTQLAEQRRCMESHNCAEKMGMFTLTPCLTCAWLAANREGKP